MQHPELPLFALLSSILVLIPAIWHWRSRNVAILALIFWLSIADFISFVNSIVWAGNVSNPIPVWCDITSKFLAGASYALPLATLCICKHLEMVSSSRKVTYDAKDRQRRMIFEGIMCFGVPVIFMVLHYIVQGHRYDIFENTGCQAAVYISVQAILIIWFPQLLFSVISLIYATLALHNFIRRRLIFAAHLQNSNSALTTNRYLRLMAMAVTEMVWCTTLTSYNLWNNVEGGLRPWTNWDDVHSNFSRVATFTSREIPPEFLRIMMLFWWSLPASSFIFFIFFGFGEEALKEYKKCGRWFKKTILRRPIEEKKKGGLFGSIPTVGAPRPLHLLSLKTQSSTMSTNPNSPSTDFHSKSPNALLSPLSASSATLTTSPTSGYYEHKKAKSLEAQEEEDVETASHYTRESAPSYYASTYTHPGVDVPLPIARPIVAHRGDELEQVPRSVSSCPEIALNLHTRESDTFTLSTFSYYGVGQSSLTPVTPTTPTHVDSLPCSPTPSTFPPAPESPMSAVRPSLPPPPPRRGMRHVGSDGSVNSTSSTASAAERRRVLGVSGGAIFVTVHRTALSDTDANADPGTHV